VSRPVNLHATVVAIAGQGILLRGASGSGKSALALALLRRAELLGLEAALVCDDQVFVEVIDGCVEAVRPNSIGGLIEIFGVGIVPEPSIPRAGLGLIVDLLDTEALERMPEVETAEIAGIALRRITLPARQASYGADVIQSLLWRRGAGR
jgi:serine kinase of HPr protein (carbohydrate metabolism regulator)